MLLVDLGEVQRGDEHHILDPGDAIAYNGDLPHRTRRLDGTVRLLIVTTDED